MYIDPSSLNKHYFVGSLPPLQQKKSYLTSLKQRQFHWWMQKIDTGKSYQLKKVAILPPGGQYRWLRMPLKSNQMQKNTIATSKMHQQVSRGFSIITDGILVYWCGETIEKAISDHNHNPTNLLDRAREVKLKLNRQKMRLQLTEVLYIGCLLTSQGLCPDPERVRSIQPMPKPSNAKSMQWLLGFVNYMTKFLPCLSDESGSLRCLLDTGATWIWLLQHDTAFNRLKIWSPHTLC